ncbi:hypothetical protein, partial [Caballeronia sp. ATUFL_F1_KS4A]|uniref:hypothetical protein n=1 Tax=Caballeronia sp. ATUFL_F1_KS4A TaxID=2921768 RepID=UPI002029360E
MTLATRKTRVRRARGIEPSDRTAARRPSQPTRASTTPNAPSIETNGPRPSRAASLSPPDEPPNARPHRASLANRVHHAHRA